MTSEQWQKADAVFESALGRPVADREAWVRSACDDPEIVTEVLQLLAASEKAEGFLDGSANVFAADLIAAAGEVRLPELIGPYRPIRELGRGGMGAVFLAERADGHYEHLVALKVLGRQFPSEDLRKRFIAERQILATLNHPGIARLLDGGVADDQVLYFALDYVDGRPIDRYCAEERVGLRERLDLFLEACDAVAYAHRSLVVHRDLKPSNILVEESGRSGGVRVKLLDFGIAKILDPDSLSAAVPVTVTGLHVMTPEYASPEQVRGDPVTTVSDVYQLGVLLFGLLTGTPLNDFSGRSITEIARVIGHVEAPRPSSAPGTGAGFPVAKEAVRRQLRGDLDAIVGKALRKEPEARYESVDRLAEDIRRYLERKPVRAHTGTFSYRSRKFARRHRWAVAGALCVVLAVAGYVVSVGSLQARTAKERDRAEQYAEFLTGLFASPNPFAEAPGDPDMTVKELFDRAVDRVRTELADDPDMQADLLRTIGRVYKGLEYNTEAHALYEESLGLYSSLRGADSDEAFELRREIAWLSGDPRVSDSLFLAQLDHAREVEGGTGPLGAHSMVAYGSFMQRQGRLVEAESTLAVAVRVLRAGLPELEDEMIGGLYFLGQVRIGLGKLAAADSVLREAYRLRVDQVGRDHPSAAVVMTELGKVAEFQGDFEEAMRWKRMSMEIFEKTLGEDHSYSVAATNNLAVLLDGMGEWDEASRLFRRVYGQREARYGPDGEETVGSLQNLAAVTMRQGRLDEAESMLLDVIGRFGRAWPEGHFQQAFPRLTLAEVYLKKREYADAEHLGREALAILVRFLPAGHPLISIAESRLGGTLLETGRYAEAERLLVRSYQALSGVEGFGDRKENARVRLATLYERLGRADEAARLLPAPVSAGGG